MVQKEQYEYEIEKFSDYSHQFPDEIVHLEFINHKLDQALEEVTAEVEQADEKYMAMKKYMVEHRNDIDPHEMFQNEMGLKQMDRMGALIANKLESISRIKETPYFARIDFQEKIDEKPDIFYIGRFGFRHDNELLVLDWRSPIASMFYDYEIGAASYTAPAGKIEGKLIRKRQFKIKNGVMEYAFESSINIQDNILQQELSQTSDEKMKSIIATIQKEQNQVIRNENGKTMIIQGVAGSGKTSIALHRIAYLLYRFKNSFSSKNVTILSPNKVFGDYISSVLPEFGEEKVEELTLVDIAKNQLKKEIGFEKPKDSLELIDITKAERIRFKSTLDFVKELDQFIEHIPEFTFNPTDCSFGRFSESADMIRRRFLAYHNHPVKRRIKMMTDDIYERFQTDNIVGETPPNKREILITLNQMLKVKSTLSLYKTFFERNGWDTLFVMPNKKTIEWEDVYPFLYVKAAFEGLDENKVIKHLVIDEMQDYTPIQFEVLNLLFKCQKTILGDFNQLINPNHYYSLEDIKQIYTESEFVELIKSYRSTFEIISFAKNIKNIGAIEAVERHGKTPMIIKGEDKEELKLIKKEIEYFKKQNYTSLGMITKTNEEAKELYEKLSLSDEVHLISPESTSFKNGILITSIQMSKGLEFDKVIIMNANKEKYSTEYDRNLLYIACTRAMHQLTILYTGELSPLLKNI